MRALFESWMDGTDLLIEEFAISYYAFFTSILTEIAILWGFFPEMAIPFTWILSASIVNVIVCSFFKGMREGEREELIFARVYLIIFGILFLIGIIINWLASILLFVIPLTITFLWINIREFQITSFVGKFPKIIRSIEKIFSNKVFWLISQIFVVGLPLVIFGIFVILTSLSPSIKLLIIVGYAFLVPYIAFIEDAWAICNIFELAYDVTWSEEYEKMMRKFDERMERDPEGTKKELVEELEKFKDDIEEIFEKNGEEKEKSDD